MTRVSEIDPVELERLRLGDGPWVLAGATIHAGRDRPGRCS